jgi:hypothetical protein
MSTSLIELRDGTGQFPDDMLGLRAKLVELLGAPFRFARVSYGDELTLHFGDIRPARSRKLNKLPYGTYVLGVRGSSWVIKSGIEPVIWGSGVVPIISGRPAVGTPLSNTDLEGRTLFEVGSRVLQAEPFPVRPIEGVGLQLTMSDGSVLIVLPTPKEPEEEMVLPTPKEPEEEKEALPELADWNLLSPHGLIQAGPGLRWSFQSNSLSRPA